MPIKGLLSASSACSVALRLEIMNNESRVTLIRFAQAVWVGIAEIIALSLAQLPQLIQSYWAAISAFVVMGADISQTLAASRDRLTGTAVGACLGALFVMLWGNQLWAFGIAVTVTVLFCAAVGLDRSYRLGCVTVAIVMVIRSPDSPWVIALHHFLEVGLEIVVALAISVLSPNPLPASANFGLN